MPELFFDVNAALPKVSVSGGLDDGNGENLEHFHRHCHCTFAMSEPPLEPRQLTRLGGVPVVLNSRNRSVWLRGHEVSMTGSSRNILAKDALAVRPSVHS